jgi:hypothetical protein
MYSDMRARVKRIVTGDLRNLRGTKITKMFLFGPRSGRTFGGARRKIFENQGAWTPIVSRGQFSHTESTYQRRDWLVRAAQFPAAAMSLS